ncbi:MAG: hypothetical protein WC758_02200 [Candidatus Woesearchaeota archaeon]|jgi:hypothetical protein
MEFTNLENNSLNSDKSRVLYLNVIGTIEEVGKNLKQLGMNLGALQGENMHLESSYNLPLFSLATNAEHAMKRNDLLGRAVNFEVAHLDSAHKRVDSAKFAIALAERMNPLDVLVTKEKTFTVIDILPLNEVLAFNRNGIVNYSRDKEVRGKDALKVIASYIHQDVGILVVDNQKLVYTFDSSMYEKTPKDIVTGNNKFIGQDAFAFHGKAKNFGHVLPELFRGLKRNFENGKLDGLIIDLKGGNSYSNGGMYVRRFERDYVVPVIQNGNLQGIIAYADVFFQADVPQGISHFDGGKFLKIDDPATFHRDFKVIKNDNYKTSSSTKSDC